MVGTASTDSEGTQEGGEAREPLSKPLPHGVPYVTLNNGVAMPQEGFGVFQISGRSKCKKAVMDALECGYRLIDTAQFYRNEGSVGEAIAESGVPREDIFLTTKVWITHYGYDKTIESIRHSLAQLRTDYADLVLLHQGVGNYLWAYRALEDLCHDGVIRAIGISNMEPDRFVDLAKRAHVIPAVNQIENHVFCQQREALGIMREYGIQPESWAPFAEGKNGLFTHPVLTEIGEQYGKTAAQVALRSLVQRDIVVIPKSVHRERIEENIDIWDFELSDSDMNQIDALDTGKSLFGYARMFSSMQRFGLFTAKKKY